MKTKIEPLLYDRSQAAQLLNISVTLLDRLVVRQELKPTRAGDRILFCRAELERFASATA